MMRLSVNSEDSDSLYATLVQGLCAVGAMKEITWIS